jgi:DNA-binding NarL/FixJ family response regulator
MLKQLQRKGKRAFRPTLSAPFLCAELSAWLGRVTTNGTVSTLIVDDDESVRLLISSVLRADAERTSVAGLAGTGRAGVDEWRQTRPDVVLLDYRLPDISGLEAAGRILAEDPGQAIVLYSAFLDKGLIEQAAALGVRTCLAKNDLEELTRTLRGCGMRSSE